MIDLNDCIYIGKEADSKRQKLYWDNCNKDRGYGMKSRTSLLCKTCVHVGKDYLYNKRNDDYKNKMSSVKKGC